MKLLITIFVVCISLSLHSKEGDIYFCETTNIVQIKNGSNNEFNNTSFFFLRQKDRIDFLSDGFFEGHYMPITTGFDEVFKGDYKSQEMFVYIDGLFTYSIFGVEGEIISMSANCNIK